MNADELNIVTGSSDFAHQCVPHLPADRGGFCLVPAGVRGRHHSGVFASKEIFVRCAICLHGQAQDKTGYGSWKAHPEQVSRMTPIMTHCIVLGS